MTTGRDIAVVGGLAALGAVVFVAARGGEEEGDRSPLSLEGRYIHDTLNNTLTFRGRVRNHTKAAIGYYTFSFISQGVPGQSNGYRSSDSAVRILAPGREDALVLRFGTVLGGDVPPASFFMDVQVIRAGATHGDIRNLLAYSQSPLYSGVLGVERSAFGSYGLEPVGRPSFDGRVAPMSHVALTKPLNANVDATWGVRNNTAAAATVFLTVSMWKKGTTTEVLSPVKGPEGSVQANNVNTAITVRASLTNIAAGEYDGKVFLYRVLPSNAVTEIANHAFAVTIVQPDFEAIDFPTITSYRRVGMAYGILA